MAPTQRRDLSSARLRPSFRTQDEDAGRVRVPRNRRQYRKSLARALRSAPSLSDVLVSVPDPREPRGRRHLLPSILRLICLGTLCQQNGYRAIALWARQLPKALKRRLGFVHFDTPAPSTLFLVLKQLPVDAIEAAIQTWVTGVLEAAGPNPAGDRIRVAIDGKRLRGSASAGADVCHVLSVAIHSIDIVLGSKGISNKKGELSAASPLLESVLKPEMVVTGDALFTNRKVVNAILACNAHYALAVKRNQRNLHSKIDEMFSVTGVERCRLRWTTELDLQHGRSVDRSLTSIDLEPGELDWPGAKQIYRFRRKKWDPKRNALKEEVVYGVTSLADNEASTPQLLQLVMEHWTIESTVHWVRDVVFREDASRVHVGNIPIGMSLLRGVCLNILATVDCRGAADARAELAANPRRALRLIGV